MRALMTADRFEPDRWRDGTTKAARRQPIDWMFVKAAAGEKAVFCRISLSASVQGRILNYKNRASLRLRQWSYKLMSKRMVEATVKKRGRRVAVGIMNTTQALDMPETEGMEFSHPDEKPGETEVRLTQSELAEVVKP